MTLLKNLDGVTTHASESVRSKKELMFSSVVASTMLEVMVNGVFFR